MCVAACVITLKKYSDTQVQRYSLYSSVTLTFSIVPITFLFSFFNKDDCSVSMNLSRCFACFGLRAP